MDRQSVEHCYTITLTQKVNSAPLATQLRELSENFATLRTRLIWKDHVLGGAFAYHLVRDKEPTYWFPHLHVVASTIPPKDRAFDALPWSAHWKSITGNSYVVEVKEVTNVADEPYHLMNYIFRPVFEPFETDPEMMAEFVAATRGKPMVNIMGSWRGDNTVVAEEDLCPGA